VQSGADTLVQYDRDGLSADYVGKPVAVLQGTTASGVLAGVNSSPAKSDKLYLIETMAIPGVGLLAGWIGSLSEDSSATLNYRIVLGQAPSAPVTVTVQGGDQITGQWKYGVSHDHLHDEQLVDTAERAGRGGG